MRDALARSLHVENMYSLGSFLLPLEREREGEKRREEEENREARRKFHILKEKTRQCFVNC